MNNLTKVFSKLKNSSFSSSLMLAFTQSVIALVFIVIDYIFSKKLNTEDFGIWKKMFFFISFLIPILSFGIPEGYKYYIAKENKKQIHFSNAMFMYLLMTGIGVFLLFILNLLHIFNFVDIKEYYLVSLLFPLGYLVFNLNKSLRYSYINSSLVWINTKITTIFYIPLFIIIILTYLYADYYISYYLWIGIFLYLLIFGLPIWNLMRKLKLSLRFSEVSFVEIKKMLKIGFPLYLSTFIGFMVINIAKGLVSLFESTETFAIFSVGALEIPIFAMLSSAFSQQDYPSLVRLVSENKKEEAKERWIKTTLRVSYITYPMILVLIIFAKPLIFFIYTNEYGDSVYLFQIYLLVGLFRNNYYGALITASGNTKYITYYSLLTMVFNLILSCLLYYFIGLEGIVYGTLFSTMIIAFMQLKHEGLLSLYFKRFIFNKAVLVILFAIIISFIYF